MAAAAQPTDDLAFDDAFLHKLERLAVVAKRVAARHGRGERRTRHVGSGIEFADRGTQQLKGVPGEWRLYAVA